MKVLAGLFFTGVVFGGQNKIGFTATYRTVPIAVER